MSNIEKDFNSPSAPLSAAEQALKDRDIEYLKQSDGTLMVQGNIDLSGRNLAALPDLSSVMLTGSFYCDHNKLTSLKGAPLYVRGDFRCDGNRLVSLEGAPYAFRKLTSDFGEFRSWKAVPEQLRPAPEPDIQMDLQNEAAEETGIKIHKPLRLKMRPSSGAN